MWNPRYKNKKLRNSVISRLKAREDGWICALCGKPIQRHPAYPIGHPLSWSCDEIVPVSKGGSPYDINNCQPAHLICNMKKGNKIIQKGTGKANKLPHSRNGKDI